jgi:hypothetical protein
VKPIPAANPKNRFAASLVEYFDDLPGPEVELAIYEDHTQQVLAENDSPATASIPIAVAFTAALIAWQVKRAS